MKSQFKTIACLFVLIGLNGLNVSNAGSYDDFFNAIKSDNPATIKQLLARNFDVNTVDPQGQYGLLIALREPSLKVAEVLINTPHIDLNVLTPQGESPLMLAALKGQLELAEKMLKKGADVNKTGWTPLHYAASSGQVKIIQLLLENHAYIDAESPNGTTPLMMASMYANTETVQLLLDEGADPLLKNQQGLTALHFAQQAHRMDSAEIVSKSIQQHRLQRPPGQW